MPAIWAGRRRLPLAGLGALGALQVALALLMAATVTALLSPEIRSDGWDMAVLAASAGGVGLARWMERVLAEQTGQDYVFEQRRRLLTAAVAAPEYSGSLGVTVTRASNDLSAVRNWVAAGVVPLITGVPLVAIVLAALLAENWRVGLAVAVPLVVVGALLPLLAKVTLRRARALRRRRGRLSAHIADTVVAGESVRQAGAVARELNALDRASGRVVDAAVDRAWVTGLTRALTATAATSCTVAVVMASSAGVADASQVASTLTLLGVMAAPVTDLGRVVEYRQNYRAAARILAPLLQRAEELKEAEGERARRWLEQNPGGLSVGDRDRPRGVRIAGLEVDGAAVAELVARPGARLRVTARDPHRVRRVLRECGEVRAAGMISVDGYDYGAAPDKVRRALVGVATAHVPVERGSVGRLLSYRVPDAQEAERRRTLRRVGLGEKVDADDRGLLRRLKNGGRPWSVREVTLLKIARAVLGDPPLLVLDGVDDALDDADAAQIKELLAGYPGVVVLASARPERLVEEYSEWCVDSGEGVPVSGAPFLSPEQKDSLTLKNESSSVVRHPRDLPGGAARHA